jgi:hypothetical protein
MFVIDGEIEIVKGQRAVHSSALPQEKTSAIVVLGSRVPLVGGELQGLSSKRFVNPTSGARVEEVAITAQRIRIPVGS